MFIDEVTVKLRAGKGGDGCVSFRREKFVPKGGPNGGDGGKGGDVVLFCDENVADLTAYKFKPHAAAKNGEHGRGSDQDGKSGPECVLKVPPGTVVSSVETGKVVTELVEHEQRVVLLRGGKGGRGNASFKSSVNRAPRQSTPGKPGEEGQFKLVLKTIADVGLVGFPNAGKSTLISLFTHAHPKTAAYPFTTLNPIVGVVEYPERYDRILLADIPGLIEGAHENRGLGHRFLRHIERCKVLLLILDMAGIDGRDPADDYEHLLKELGLYSNALLEKPRLVAANKMDERQADENLAKFRKKHEVKILPISCLLEEGISELKESVYKQVDAFPANS